MSGEENKEEVKDGVQEEKQEEQKEEKKLAGSNFYKQKISDMEAENAKLKAAIEDKQTEALKEKQNFKELWELEKTKRKEAEEKATKISTSYFNGLKLSAIEQEALKAGIVDAALSDIEMLDNSMVQIETTSTGNANVLGAKEFVENLKETKPHWFKAGGAPNINNANPEQTQVKQMSHSDLIQLQKKDPEKYKEEMKKRFKLA